MSSSILITIDGANGAKHVAAWLPVLVSARFDRASLFHAVPEGSPDVSQDLDALRPLLDKLAVALTAHGIQTDIAFKRGDVVKWLIALAELRHSNLIVASVAQGEHPLPDYLERLCLESPVPVLVLPAGLPGPDARLDARPVLLGCEEEARIMTAASDLVHAPLVPVRLTDGADLPDASVLVTGPAPAGGRLAELLGGASCPVLLYSSRSIGAPLGAS